MDTPDIARFDRATVQAWFLHYPRPERELISFPVLSRLPAHERAWIVRVAAVAALCGSDRDLAELRWARRCSTIEIAWELDLPLVDICRRLAWCRSRLDPVVRLLVG